MQLTGCTEPRLEFPPPKTIQNQRIYNLMHPATVIRDRWHHYSLSGKTEYRIAYHNGQLAIRAVGRNSASGLMRRVNVDPKRCPVMKWSWFVTRTRPNADIRVKEREDVAASIFLLFGDPGFMLEPISVPTLRYVWTNQKVSQEEIVDNPYLPGTVKSIVIENGDDHGGKWRIEQRNVVKDFEKAFGFPPGKNIHAIALFTDNDQTKQPVEAYYGWVQLICKY